jgi:crotonobetainyl-CoA:carnitine CoA-transferase CaiB-like acyl-CoA transferase
MSGGLPDRSRDGGRRMSLGTAAASSHERAEPNRLPLEGVRVVDMSTSYAGPTACMYLADLGADVVKVERPGGDDARSWGPPFAGPDSAWFISANRNKKSIVIDLRTAAGQDVLRRLLSTADVFVENLNPSKLERFGLEPRSILQRHPRIVFCALSGFGLDGPDAHLPGYDLVAQARSGLMSVTGARGGPPQRVSTALSDIVAALVATLAVVAALRRVDQGGPGEIIDVSLLDADLALMAPRIASFLAGEPEPSPSGGTDSVLSVYQAFETADRPIVLAVGNDTIWRRLCTTLALGLGEEPGLETNQGRRASRGRITEAIARELRRQPAKVWLQRFASAGIPAAPIASLSEVIADPHIAARGSIAALPEPGPIVGTDRPPHGVAGTRVVASPWRFADTATVWRHPPALGDHTAEILGELGFSDEQADDLRQCGAVRYPAS